MVRLITILLLLSGCGDLNHQDLNTDYPIVKLSIEPCVGGGGNNTCTGRGFDSYFRIITTGNKSGWVLDPTTTGLYQLSGGEGAYLRQVEVQRCRKDKCKILKQKPRYELYLPACSTYSDTHIYRVENTDNEIIQKVYTLEKEQLTMICLGE